MLVVGKTYAHSKSGMQNAWKITHQWGPDLFEGHHINSGGVGSPVMFDRFGKPIGARGKAFYNPENWHLVEPKRYEYICLYADDVSKEWYELKPNAVTYGDSMYVVREKNKTKTAQLMTTSELNKFCKELQ